MSANLLNRELIGSSLLHEAAWADSHGAADDFLGAGLLYYALAYALRAKLCVCLGSGGGFVPRMMRQAQRDLVIADSRTVLVDGNCGPFGRPKWLAEDSFFRREFSDISLIVDTTQNARQAAEGWRIDYLHIDADHSYLGSLSDFDSWAPLVSPKGIITFHDTCGDLPSARALEEIRRRGRHEILNFRRLAAGVALIRPR